MKKFLFIKSKVWTETIKICLAWKNRWSSHRHNKFHHAARSILWNDEKHVRIQRNM